MTHERPGTTIALPILVAALLPVIVRFGLTLTPELWLLAPELIMIIAASLVLALGFSVGRSALALVTLVATGEAAIICLFQVWGIGGAALPSAGVAFGLLQVDAFALVLKLVFLAVTALVALASPTALPGRNQGEYYSLLLFATVGMMMVAGSRDLIMLFLGFELASFASYALSAYRRRDPASAEAGMKFFITGSVSSAIVLFGISLVYALTAASSVPTVQPGDVGFTNIAALFRGGFDAFNPLVVFAAVFLLAGFGFKVAAFPFHMWAPDVYDGSPTPVSAFLAAGSKKMGFAALFKVFLVGLIAVRADWMVLAGVVAIATMTIGNVLALTQTNMKRLLAYSSIAQAGYILIALPVAAAVPDAAGQYALAGGIFHIITHAFMKAGAFIVIAALVAVGLTERIDDFKGLSRRAPVMAFAMAVFLISFAGIPPLAGFASKFVLFSGAVQASLLPDQGWLILLAIAGVANSAISLYYYAKVVRLMYVEAPEPHQAAALHVPAAITASVVIALVAVIAIGLWPQPVIDVSMRAAQSLIAAGAPFR
jgi:F420H2 dehydrogenase subunit N